jgi:hypothetical protein
MPEQVRKRYGIGLPIGIVVVLVLWCLGAFGNIVLVRLLTPTTSLFLFVLDRSPIFYPCHTLTK